MNATTSSSSIMEVNTSPKIRSNSTSMNTTDVFDPGLRLVQEFSDYLKSALPDDRKQLLATFLELIDEECLNIIQRSLGQERKNRKKNKDKETVKAKRKENNSLSIKNGKDADSHSNQTGSIGSSSMEVISEVSPNQQQTSSSTGSRRTFAGFFTSKRGDKKEKVDKKISKKDKDKGTTSNGINDSGNDAVKETTAEVHVDDEGYIIPPHVSLDGKRKDSDKFYSDSDSSDDDEGPQQPIHIVIKPKDASTSGLKGTGSILELKQIVGGLSISPHFSTSRKKGDSRAKRRQISVASNPMTCSEEGPLKRSVSQHLYKNEKERHPPHSTSNLPLPSNNLVNGYNSSLNSSGASRARENVSSDDRYAALRSIFSDYSSSGNSTNQPAPVSGSTSNSISSSPSIASQTSINLSKSMSSFAAIGPPPPLPPRPKRNPPPTQVSWVDFS